MLSSASDRNRLRASPTDDPVVSAVIDTVWMHAHDWFPDSTELAVGTPSPVADEQEVATTNVAQTAPAKRRIGINAECRMKTLVSTDQSGSSGRDSTDERVWVRAHERGAFSARWSHFGIEPAERFGCIDVERVTGVRARFEVDSPHVLGF